MDGPVRHLEVVVEDLLGHSHKRSNNKVQEMCGPLEHQMHQLLEEVDGQVHRQGLTKEDPHGDSHKSSNNRAQEMCGLLAHHHLGQQEHNKQQVGEVRGRQQTQVRSHNRELPLNHGQLGQLLQ